VTRINLRMLSAIAALVALGGCATDPLMRPYWTLHDADFRQLKPGLTKAEVEKIVGSPMVKVTFPRLAEETWDYRYLDIQTRMRATVHFDTRGIVKYHTQRYDMDYYSTEGI